MASSTSIPAQTAPARAAAAPPVAGDPRRRDAARLLAHARAVLDEAAATSSAPVRFSHAHLAALRAAAAMFAVRARPAEASARRRRPVSAWALIETTAPELAEWAAYFAAGATQRAAVEAGASSAVSRRDADDELRAAGQFIDIVAGLIDADRPRRQRLAS